MKKLAIISIIILGNFLLILSFFALIINWFFNAPAPPLIIPTENEVNQIIVNKRQIESGHDMVCIIEDKKQILNLLNFLKPHKYNWHYPLGDTMPIYPYQATFTNSKKIKLVIWFGNGSLGARDGEDSTSDKGNFLSSKEEKKLFDLATIKTCNWNYERD